MVILVLILNIFLSISLFAASVPDDEDPKGDVPVEETLAEEGSYSLQDHTSGQSPPQGN